jgi:endoglucanase
MLLKKLSDAAGVSSNENEVRNIIKEEIDGLADSYRTDVMGNLIAVKGKDKKGPKVMVVAHMDEIGLMITSIKKNGLLKFRPVGGIDKRVLVSKPVLIGEKKIKGIIGAKAIHLQKPKERKKPIPLSNLYIDIGVNSKEKAKKSVKKGDFVSFNTKFAQLGINHAKGKAFDDRVGCAALIDLLKHDYDFPLYTVFAVQEEVGLRGAARAAYDIEPDLALVVEGTSASDVPETDEHGYSTTIDEGPALTVMDSSVITSKNILKGLIDTANKKDLPYQFRRANVGGTDAGKINLTREGIPAAVISLPCRYIHSPISLISLKDYDYLKKLLKSYLNQLNKEEF